MTATMCQLVSTGPAVNRAEPADFHCPPPLFPLTYLETCLVLDSHLARRAALRLRYHKNPFPTGRNTFLSSALPLSCLRNALLIQIAPARLCEFVVSARLLLLWHSSHLSGFISCCLWRKQPWTRRRPTTRSGRCSAGAVASRECSLNIRITTTSCQTRGNISPKKGVFKST